MIYINSIIYHYFILSKAKYNNCIVIILIYNHFIFNYSFKNIKINEKITVNEQSYYMSIIYGKDNPNEDSIKQFYTLNIDQLKEK